MQECCVRRLGPVLAGLVLTAAILALYAPALGFTLIGDDYQWLQLAHRAMHRPALLLADLDTFYRPLSTWTLVIDRLVAGHHAVGYYLTNLLLHSAAGIGLAVAARRLGLGSPFAWAAALLWATSPFTEEPAVAVAIRFEDLLMLAWLALIVVWPRQGESWSRRRALGVVGAVVAAALSKETWVVTPALVAALELGQHRAGPRQAARSVAAASAAVLAYVAVYFSVFPGDKSYYRASLALLAKVPNQLAAFLNLEGLVPVLFPFTWRGALALVVTAGIVALAVRKAPAAAAVGTVLLFAPTVPTLLVPYMPTRYTSIPYGGFVLLAAALVEAGVAGTPRRWRWAIATAGAGVALLVLAAGAVTVRADLVDGGRFSAAHSRLLREAEAVAPAFPLDRPVLVVREETDNPARDIVTSPHGLPKLIFVRGSDPDGLIDAPALFEWVIDREDVRVVGCGDPEMRFTGRPGAVLAHRPDGFVWLARGAPDIAAVARSARLAGLIPVLHQR